VIGHVPVGSKPDSVDVGEGAVWVANIDDKTLMRVDPHKHAVEHTFSLDATPTGIVVGFGAVWVANGLLGTVSRIAPQYTGIETIRTAYTPLGGAGARGSIAVGDRSIWVAFGDSSVSRIDPKSRGIIATAFAGNTPSAIAYGRGSVWVVNEADSKVTRINPLTNGRYSLPISVGLRPHGVAVGGGAVWVTDTGVDQVSRIDPGSGSSTSFSVGNAPAGIDYGAGSVWVANSGDGTVSRIDPVTSKVVATIRVGNSPRGIAVGAGKIWVTVQTAGTT
jgi:YVTN family beta-propeller protein